MTAFAPGLVLEERFEIIEEVGAGGMGVVYRAHDRSFGRDVALKVLRDQLLMDTESVQRFQREARLISVLKHPNIMEIYSVFVTREGTPVPYFAMEFLRGVQMSALLQEHGPFAWRELLPYMIEVCDALQFAHEQQIVHRDIKPSNIMLVEEADGRRVAKVVDFGIAKSIAESGPKLTKTNMMMGSVPYMSPSDFAGRPASPASDIYALGCTMMELLSGKPPFMGETIFDTISQHSSAQVPRVSELNPLANKDLPSDLQNLLFWMLEKDPEKRAPSAVAVRNCLEAILAGKPAPISKTVIPKKSGSARKAWIISAAVLGFLAICAAGAIVPGLIERMVAERYLTKDHARERELVDRLNENPKNFRALMDLAAYYSDSQPKYLGVSRELLSKALHLAPTKLEKSEILLLRAVTDAQLGDYNVAIADSTVSQQLLAQSEDEAIGQRKVRLVCYTPLAQFGEQIRESREFFSLRNSGDKSITGHEQDYIDIFDDTFEALIRRGLTNEALDGVKYVRKLHLPGYDPTIWELIAKAYQNQRPPQDVVKRIHDQADDYHRGIVDLRLGWAMDALPGMNNDGSPYIANGLDEMLNAPPDPDPVRRTRLLDAADRCIDCIVIELDGYNGEMMNVRHVQKQLLAVREKHAKEMMSVPKRIPFEL